MRRNSRSKRRWAIWSSVTPYLAMRSAGQVAAAAVPVFDDVLPEVGELQAGADLVRKLRALFVAEAGDPKDESPDGVGGEAGILDQAFERLVFEHALVLLEGGDEVGEEGLGGLGGVDGGTQGDEDGVQAGGGVGVAFAQHGAPFGEQTGGGCGVGYFVAEVVGDAAEGVDAFEVGPDAFGQEPGGDVEVFVVGGGQVSAPGLGLGEGGARGGRGVVGRCAFERGGEVGLRGLESRCGHGSTTVLMSTTPLAERVSMPRKTSGSSFRRAVPVRKASLLNVPPAMSAKAVRQVAGVW